MCKLEYLENHENYPRFFRKKTRIHLRVDRWRRYSSIVVAPVGGAGGVPYIYILLERYCVNNHICA